MKLAATVALIFVFTIFGLLTASVAFGADAEKEETPQQLEVRCMAEGGCATLTRREYMQALREAAEYGRQMGVVEGHKACMKKMI